MSGKGHLVSGTVLAADTYVFHICLKHATSAVFTSKFVSGICNVIETDCSIFSRYPEKTVYHQMFLWGLCILFYYIGLILPDVDYDKSAVTKVLKFRVYFTHRGIMHSVYIPLFLIIFGYRRYLLLLYMGIGCLIHDWLDGFSPAGWVMFYPIGRYHKYDNTVINHRRHMKLYNRHDGSEALFVVILSAISLAFGFFTYTAFFMNG